MAAYSVRCPVCQTVNRPGARFCSHCRSPLEAAPPVASGILPGPSTNPATSFEVPPPPPRSETGSNKWAILVVLFLILVLAAAGFWYFGLQGSSLAGLPLIGGTPATSGLGIPTLFAAPSTLVSSGPPATLLAGAPATVLAGAPATLAARISGVLQTNTPAPTATRAPGAAPASPAATAAPPDAEVIVESANLREGPATVFDVLGVLSRGDPLKVAGRNLTGDWLHVQTQAAKAGWVATSLVKLNIQLAEIPVDKAIPTPPPAPPPAAQPMPGNQGCPPNPALVSVTNRGSEALVIILQGAQNYIIDLAPGQTKNVCLAAGPYRFMATTTSGSMEQGDKVFGGGTPICWSLPSGAGAPPECNAPTDRSAYTSPPGGELPIPQGF